MFCCRCGRRGRCAVRARPDSTPGRNEPPDGSGGAGQCPPDRPMCKPAPPAGAGVLKPLKMRSRVDTLVHRRPHQGDELLVPETRGLIEGATGGIGIGDVSAGRLLGLPETQLCAGPCFRAGWAGWSKKRAASNSPQPDSWRSLFCGKKAEQDGLPKDGTPERLQHQRAGEKIHVHHFRFRWHRLTRCFSGDRELPEVLVDRAQCGGDAIGGHLPAKHAAGQRRAKDSGTRRRSRVSEFVSACARAGGWRAGLVCQRRDFGGRRLDVAGRYIWCGSRVHRR